MASMQSFLILDNNETRIDQEITNLSVKLSAKIIYFPLTKIDDVRSLGNLVRLTFSEPTLIVSKNIHEVSEEGLNAFLKNLEEPQENVYFVLTSPSARSVIPTIVSRCQIIKIKNKSAPITLPTDVENFLNYKTGQKFLYVDKLKDRGEAIKFVEGLIYFLHDKKNFLYIEEIVKTLNNLKKNGNVSLQLTNLVVRMENANG